MTYNFDEIIDRRNTNSENVEGWRPYIFHCGPERVFPYKDEEFIRMWVADMEFAVAPEDPTGHHRPGRSAHFGLYPGVR